MVSLIQFDFAFEHFDFSILFDFASQEEGSNSKNGELSWWKYSCLCGIMYLANRDLELLNFNLNNIEKSF